jgi:drug/metabolite transporter (DMT)-like permease
MKHAGELAALGTALCWAAGSNLFAAAGQRIGSVRLNRLRIATATLFLAITLMVVRGSPWPTWASRSQVFWLALSGLIGYVFADGNYFRSLVILGPGRAALLASTAPIFTAILAWPILGEHPGPLVLLGMALTLGGITWVLIERERRDHVHVEGSVGTGVVAGILGAIGQAGGYVTSKLALRTGLDPLSATVIRVGAATAAIWLIAAFQRQGRHTIDALRNRGTAGFIAGGALLGPFFGVVLALYALQHTPASVASSIIAFLPIFTILIAARFHGEKLTLRMMGGAVIAVAGVIVLFLR